MSFVDELAVVGTNVEEISSVLNGKELVRPTETAELAHQEIALKQVRFTYGDEDQEVLRGIDLDILPGTVTALVGPSGSGKSTIAKLIAGFWDVTGGSITLGGEDLKQIPLKQLNEQIAYVSQDNYLFDRTVRENIRIGKLDATDEEVEAAAKASGCDSFIPGAGKRLRYRLRRWRRPPVRRGKTENFHRQSHAEKRACGHSR